MWNRDKSVRLTHFLVRAFYFVLTAAAVVSITVPIKENLGLLTFNIIPFYVAVPVGYIALVCLDKLLINIKKGIVFDSKNVKLLRVFSWLCFFVSAVTFLFAGFAVIRLSIDTLEIKVGFDVTIFDLYYSVFAFSIAVAGIFVGVVVRVVKNIFESAIKIKEENELTI